MKKEVTEMIESHVDEFKKKFEKGDKSGQFQYIDKFPMDSVIPVACLYYVVHFVEVYEVSDDFIAMGFSLNHFKMLTPKQQNMLKAIKTEFYNDKST